MARVLVTGILGFFGSRIAEFLRKDGHEVFGTTISADPQDERLFSCDIVDADSVNAMVDAVRPDIVIHSAAISSVTSGKPLDYYRVNTVGTENLLAATARGGERRRFLFISTAGVYGNQDQDLLTETMCPKPVHHYGMSKFAAERVVFNFMAHLDCTIIRPFNLIGAGQHRDFILPKIVEAFARGEKTLRLGNIDVFRDYLDVECAARAVVALVSCEKSFGEVLNLCSGEPTSLRELLDTVQARAGYEIEIVQAAEFIRKFEVWKLLGCPNKLHSMIGSLQCKPLTATVDEMFSDMLQKLGKI